MTFAGWNQERYHYIWHAEYLFLASDRHYLLMDHKKDMVIDNYCLEPDEREASAADFVANRMKKLGQRLKK